MGWEKKAVLKALKYISKNPGSDPLEVGTNSLKPPGYSSTNYFFMIGNLLGFMHGRGWIEIKNVGKNSRLTLTAKGFHLIKKSEKR